MRELWVKTIVYIDEHLPWTFMIMDFNKAYFFIDSILLGNIGGGHVVSCIYLGAWVESDITDPIQGLLLL